MLIPASHAMADPCPTCAKGSSSFQAEVCVSPPPSLRPQDYRHHDIRKMTSSWGKCLGWLSSWEELTAISIAPRQNQTAPSYNFPLRVHSRYDITTLDKPRALTDRKSIYNEIRICGSFLFTQLASNQNTSHFFSYVAYE